MLNHFDIEQAEEFKITKYLCKTHFNMKKIKDEKSIMFLCPKSVSVKHIAYESDLKLAFGLSDSALKMIAMISMVIGHIALSDRGWSYYMKRCAI